MNKEIEIKQSVYERDEQLAAELNNRLSERGIFAINVMGAPGVGKTTSLIRIVNQISLPSYVIEGDIQSDLDVQKLSEAGIRAVQINTGGACHLDSMLITNAAENILGDEKSFENGVLFIENIGNLVCPAEFMIGEHIKLLLTNVTEGSDKPYKYPLAFEKANAILLGKRDLLPHVEFDEEQFVNGIRKLNPYAPVFKVSAKTGEGFDEVTRWILCEAQNVINKESK